MPLQRSSPKVESFSFLKHTSTLDKPLTCIRTLPHSRGRTVSTSPSQWPVSRPRPQFLLYLPSDLRRSYKDPSFESPGSMSPQECVYPVGSLGPFLLLPRGWSSVVGPIPRPSSSSSRTVSKSVSVHPKSDTVWVRRIHGPGRSSTVDYQAKDKVIQQPSRSVFSDGLGCESRNDVGEPFLLKTGGRVRAGQRRWLRRRTPDFPISQGQSFPGTRHSVLGSQMGWHPWTYSGNWRDSVAQNLPVIHLIFRRGERSS